MDVLLYRFRLAQLSGITERQALQFLQEHLKLDEHKSERFLAGKFVFKAAKLEKVERYIATLQEQGINCSKHLYVPPNNETQVARVDDDAMRRVNAENHRLKAELDDVRAQMKVLEQRLASITDPPEPEVSLTVEDLLGDEVSDDEPVKPPEMLKFAEPEQELSLPYYKNLSFMASVSMSALVFIGLLIWALGSGESTAQSHAPLMDYEALAQRHQISVEQAQQIARKLGSKAMVMESEATARRLGLGFVNYTARKNYYDRCKQNRTACENANDFVNVNLVVSAVMNHYRENCDRYTQNRYGSALVESGAIFNDYDPTSTQFKKTNKFTLTGELKTRDDTGQERSQLASCTVDVYSGQVQGMSLL